VAPKTTSAAGDVGAFVASIEDASRRADSQSLVRLMRRATGDTPRLWGSGMVGFGTYHYRYASGREGDWFKVGFAPRSKGLTIYLLSGLVGYDDLLSRLGKHTQSRSCIHIRRLSDVDMDVVRALVERSVAHIDQVESDLGAIPRLSDMPPPRP
jgi:hypothetical protein